MRRLTPEDIEMLNNIILFPSEGGEITTVGQAIDLLTDDAQMVLGHNEAVLRWIAFFDMAGRAIAQQHGPFSEQYQEHVWAGQLVAGAMNVLATMYERDMDWLSRFISTFGGTPGQGG